MAERKRSPLWRHFTEGTPGKAICRVCKKAVSMGAEKARLKNTTNMWHHLKSHHLEVYNEAQKAKQEQAAAAAAENLLQPTGAEISEAQGKWPKYDQRSKEIDRLITEMIATDNQPFAIVSEVGFQRLMAYVEPKYSLKGEKYYRTDVMDGLHSRVEKRIRTLVLPENAGNHLAFTVDCRPGETESLMSLSCHFIDKNWERKQAVLNVKATSGSHTGDYLSKVLLSTLEYWGIDRDRVMLVLRDTGAYMIEDLKLVGVPDLSCSAHTLQLIVNEAISSQKTVGDIITKLQTCAAHFNHSILAKQRLRDIQKAFDLPQQSISQAETTQWNSTLRLLKRMLEQKRALNIYASEHGQFSTLSPDEWTVVSDLIKTLSPIEEVTLELSKAEASISSIIPSIAVLKMVLQVEGPTTKGIQSLRDTMLQSLVRRFAKSEENKCLVLATLLDPRYKGHLFAMDTVKKAKQWLKEEHADLCAQQNGVTTRDQGPAPKRMRVGDEEVEEKPTPSGLVAQMFANLLGVHGATVQNSKQDVSEQLYQYLSEPLIDRQTGHPLEWWKENSARLCFLAPLARKYLCPRPSSSERVFSEAGVIHDERRNRLTAENAEHLYFLHHNLQLLNWDY